jgi:uncharacterized protein (DUF362 family)
MSSDNTGSTYTRRAVLKGAIGLGVLAAAASDPAACLAAAPRTTRVVLVHATDRAAGARKAIDMLHPSGLARKTVLLKPNYNTGDPAPAATDTGLLEAIIQELRNAGSGPITIGDRSGMAVTRQAMKNKGVFQLAERYGVRVTVFDEMDAQGWRPVAAAGTHWQHGFAIARPVLDAGAIVSTSCLKTHRFGGHFSLSLKNTVGMLAKQVPGAPHDYMAELHASPYQRLMIAEANAAYRPALIVLDGVQAFVTGGPEAGTVAQPGVILAGTDRVAVDVVAIALLRTLGTTQLVAQGSIWQQEQIRRAVELGIGVGQAAQITIVTADAASQRIADKLRRLL